MNELKSRCGGVLPRLYQPVRMGADENSRVIRGRDDSGFRGLSESQSFSGSKRTVDDERNGAVLRPTSSVQHVLNDFLLMSVQLLFAAAKAFTSEDENRQQLDVIQK